MQNSSLNILSWAEEDRPREKLLQKGKSTLSDSELMAILIGSGTVSISAVELSKQILSNAENNLNELAKFSVKDLQKFRGIGEAKAVSIVAAMELGRRRKSSEIIKKLKVQSSKDIYDYMIGNLMDLKHEEFWVIFLNRSNTIISKHQISSGGVSGTVVDPKMVFKMALDYLASSIVLVHNHPSGNLQPSGADVRLTKKMKEAGLLLEVPVLDHIIVTDLSYFSFADEELL